MPPSNMSIQTGSPSPLPTRHADVKSQTLPADGTDLLRDGMKGRWDYSQEKDQAREASDWNK